MKRLYKENYSKIAAKNKLKEEDIVINKSTITNTLENVVIRRKVLSEKSHCRNLIAYRLSELSPCLQNLKVKREKKILPYSYIFKNKQVLLFILSIQSSIRQDSE